MAECLPYFDDNFRVLGPYLNKKQGRRLVTLTDKTSGKSTQKSYAKYLLENHLGRKLSSSETVDHIDRNKLNDTLDNLQILSQSDHTKLDNKRTNKIVLPCAWCGKVVERSPRFLRMRAKRNQAGPFCSGSCRGKYGASIQNGGTRFQSQPFERSVYYYVDKNPGYQ